MKINVTFFGPMIDATGKENELLDVTSTSELKNVLDENYPDSTGINYTISVNQAIVEDDTVFAESDEVAILPPFAGG